jgi:hypothetical protein
VKLKFIQTFSVFALAGCAVVSLSAQKNAAGSVFAPDKGRFTINLDGKAIGHEEFEISPSGAGWVAKGTTSISLPESGVTKVAGSLALQSDGVPISYEWTSQAEKTNGAHIIFVNGVAKITLEMQGARPFEQDLTFTSPLIALLDNNLYHHYAVIGRIYDWSKGGTQTFPVLIPQELTPGTITVESAGSASSGGKNYEGLRVTTSDLEILLLFDSNHRMMRLEVPAVKVSVVRD